MKQKQKNILVGVELEKKSWSKTGRPLAEVKQRALKSTALAKKTVKSGSQKPARQLALKETPAVDIDHFLVDEQSFVFNQIQLVAEAVPQPDLTDADSGQPQPTQLKKALDRLWQTGHYSISLNRQGNLSKLEDKVSSKNSAFTLNLKKEVKGVKNDGLPRLVTRLGSTESRREAGKFLQPGKTMARQFELASVSLILPRQKIKDIFTPVNRLFSRLFYLPASPSASQGGPASTARLDSSRPAKRGEPAKPGQSPKLSPISQPFALVSRQPAGPFWFKLKNALYFALVALLFIVPFRGYFLYRQINNAQVRVLGATETAIGGLKQGLTDASGSDWRQAGNNFALAGDYFSRAGQVISGYNQSILNFLANVPVASQKVSGGKNLILAGELLSQAAWEISQTMTLLKQPAGDDTNQNNFLDVKAGLTKALDLLRQSADALNKVESGLLPVEYRDSFSQIKERLPQLLKSFDEATDLLDFSEQVLGYLTPKRYLFVFQNNWEIRASGGFMGSYALVDLNRGKIANLEVPGGGFYDLKQSFQASGEKVLSPAPMRLLGSPWMPWDANWWPDVPTSMAKLLWFYYKSGGPSVDGVILINASVLPQILKDTGNVALPEYNEVFTPANVILALQHKTEFDYDKEENKPKKVIGDLMEVLVERLTSVSGEQLLPVLLTLHQSLENKEVQLYFTDEQLQSQANERNWTGQIKPADKDYLAVISVNIGGGKSNMAIDQRIDHYAKINVDGSITDTVALTLNHRGDKNDVFQKAQNNDYVRVYVPQGAKLLQASGYDVLDQSLFKEAYEGYQEDPDLSRLTRNAKTFGEDRGVNVYDELGKTVFGAWLQIKPGESKTLTFSYELPFKLNSKAAGYKKILSVFGLKQASVQDNYSLLVQKQSGALNTVFNAQLSWSGKYKAIWSQASNNQQINLANQRAGLTIDLDRDYLYSVLLKK